MRKLNLLGEDLKDKLNLQSEWIECLYKHKHLGEKYEG